MESSQSSEALRLSFAVYSQASIEMLTEKQIQIMDGIELVISTLPFPTLPSTLPPTKTQQQSTVLQQRKIELKD
jgi:hypothetical protein